MKISESQIYGLMAIAHNHIGLTRDLMTNGMIKCNDAARKAACLLEEISNQQSTEIKDINE